MSAHRVCPEPAHAHCLRVFYRKVQAKGPTCHLCGESLIWAAPEPLSTSSPGGTP